MGETIDRKCLTDLILSEDGLFKDVPERSRKYVVFNKADHTDQEQEARMTVQELIQMQAPIHGFIIAATTNRCIYASGRVKRNSKLGNPSSKQV
jgi:hypothetical protein